MKLDNQTIMMVVVAIVLGMLVANMFKEVCGCKNLVEGQTASRGENFVACDQGEGDGNCVWISTSESTNSVPCGVVSDTNKENYCSQNYSGVVYRVNDGPLYHYYDWGDGTTSPTNWRQSVCCGERPRPDVGQRDTSQQPRLVYGCIQDR